MSKVDDFDQICLIENCNKLDGLDTFDRFDTIDAPDILHLEMFIIVTKFVKSWRSCFRLSKVDNLEASLYKVDKLDINRSKVDNLDSKMSNVEL